MQKNNQTTIFVLLTVLGLVLLIYFAFFRNSKKHFVWMESYSVESKEPYGTFFIRQMLETYHPDGKVKDHKKKKLSETLELYRGQEPVNYVLIGSSLYLDHEETDSLVSFIKSGNDVFIATLEEPEFLLEKFFPYECGYKVTYKSEASEKVNYNFYHDSLHTPNGYNYSYRMGDKDIAHSWPYIGKGIFCDTTYSVVPLGYQQSDLANFIKIPVGDGNLFLHCSPIVFTNYYMTRPQKVEYVGAVFSHLRGKDFIWDEQSKLPFINDGEDGPGPLYWILQQPALRYAWWIFLATVLAYVLFAIKRTQRVIPVLETKRNTSLEFVNQIALLHYDNADHLDMARKKMKYFMYFIRAKYGMQHTREFGEAQKRMLAEKARINEKEVKAIFSLYDIIEKNASYNIPAYRLVDLFYAIDNFYKNCK